MTKPRAQSITTALKPGIHRSEGGLDGLIHEKIRKGKKLRLKELTEDAVRLKAPGVDPYYLMDKYTCTTIKEDTEKMKRKLAAPLLDSVFHKVMRAKARMGESLISEHHPGRRGVHQRSPPQGRESSSESMDSDYEGSLDHNGKSKASPSRTLLGKDESDYDETHTDQAVEYRRFDPETEHLLMSSVRYDSPHFKQLVKYGLKCIINAKSTPRRDQDAKKDREKL